VANIAIDTNLINVPGSFLITFEGIHDYAAQYPRFIHTVLHLPSKMLVVVMTAISKGQIIYIVVNREL